METWDHVTQLPQSWGRMQSSTLEAGTITNTNFIRPYHFNTTQVLEVFANRETSVHQQKCHTIPSIIPFFGHHQHRASWSHYHSQGTSWRKIIYRTNPSSHCRLVDSQTNSTVLPCQSPTQEITPMSCLTHQRAAALLSTNFVPSKLQRGPSFFRGQMWSVVQLGRGQLQSKILSKFPGSIRPPHKAANAVPSHQRH